MSSIEVVVDGGNLWGYATRLPVEILRDDGSLFRSITAAPRSTERVEVDSGRYLVRLGLPRGGWLTEWANVDDTGDGRDVVGSDDAVVRFEIARTGHEWLARQELSGELPERGMSLGRLDHPSLGLTWYRVWAGSPPRVVDWQFRVVEAADDGFKLEGHVPGSEPALFLQVGGPRVPWQIVTLPPVGDVEIVFSVQEEQDSAPFLGVSVMGRRWEPEWLLRFLSRGAYESARNLFEHGSVAERYLYGDVDDPLGAAVGGYYLLRAGQLDRMHHWPANLDERFPWLPDGAIIHAWYLLRRPGAQDVDLARQRLVAAARRGTPVFTEGVRPLRDGLRLFEDGEDSHAGELTTEIRARVRKLACALDWTRPFVSFAGTSPLKPTPQPCFGLPRDVAPKHVLAGIRAPERMAEIRDLVGDDPEQVSLAVELASRVLALRTSSSRAAGLLEEAAYAVPERAEEWFGRALAIEPARPGALEGLIPIVAARGDHRKLVDLYSRLGETRPDAFHEAGRHAGLAAWLDALDVETFSIEAVSRRLARAIADPDNAESILQSHRDDERDDEPST